MARRPRQRPPQAKNWCYTINNPTEEDDPNEFSEECSYNIFQHETGEDGTPHYQGFLQLKNQKRLTGMKVMNPRAHWLIAHGTATQNTVYCTKGPPPAGTRTPLTDEHTDSGPWIHGVPTNQGKRNDLLAVKEAIDTGATTKELWEDHYSVQMRYHRSTRIYKRLKTKPRDWVMDIIVYWGPTGCSKSHTVHELYGDSLYVLPSAKGSGTYWDDYDGEETVLVDEMYGNRFAFGFLLQLCDRYEFSVPVHGGAGHQFISKRIVFTSNVKPKKWYKDVCNYAAFKRRITTIVHMNVPYVAPGDIPLDVPVFPVFDLEPMEEDSSDDMPRIYIPQWDDEAGCWDDDYPVVPP